MAVWGVVVAAVLAASGASGQTVELRAAIVEVGFDAAAPGHFLLTVNKGASDGVAVGWTAGIVHRQLAMAYDTATVTAVAESTAKLRVRFRDAQDAQPLRRAYEVVLRGKPAAYQSANPPGGQRLLGKWKIVNTSSILEILPDGTCREWLIGFEAELELKKLRAAIGQKMTRWSSGPQSEFRFFDDNSEMNLVFEGETLWLYPSQIDRALAAVLGGLRLERLSAEQAALIHWPTKEETAVLARESIRQAIRNNLRQLSAAADQYYLENGVDRTVWDQIVGPDKYIKAIRPVAGEDYSGLTFRQGEALEVVTAEGEKVRYAP